MPASLILTFLLSSGQPQNNTKRSKCYLALRSKSAVRRSWYLSPFKVVWTCPVKIKGLTWSVACGPYIILIWA